MSDTESDGSSSDAYTGSFRPNGACTNCQTLKIRCQWVVDEGICVKCKTTGADCVVHGRKKRRPAMSHEQLVKRSQAQDAHIQSLLNQLDGLKRHSEMTHYVDEAHAEATALRVTPNGLGGEHSLSSTSSLSELPPIPALHAVYNYEKLALSERPSPCGVAISSDEPSAVSARATTSFFLPYYTAIDFENFECPPILSGGLFGPAEVTALFRLYFDKLYPSFPILDPVLHTPQYVLSKSSLLFTTILYVTSRIWTHRPKLHELAQAHAAGSVREASVKEGCKTIETCQALVLLSLFPAPHTSSIDSRGSMFMGVAIRIAQGLRLDEQPPADLPEREKVNRLRTWFHIVCADSSNSIQRGRPTMTHRNSFTAQMSDVWYRCSPFNSPYDIYCSAYADLMLFVSNLWGPIGPTSMNLQDDTTVIDAILEYHQNVCDRVEIWKQRIAEQQISPAAAHCDPNLNLLEHAMRLTILGVGIQHSLKRMLSPNMNLLHLAIEAARHVLKYDIEYMYPTGFLRYAIEPQYLYVTYSAAFLINMLRPCFTRILERPLRVDILRQTRTLIELFTSDAVVLDTGHMPVVFAAFLEALLDQMTAGQDLAEHPSAYPSTPTLSNSRALTHGVAAESRVSAGPVIDIHALRGAEFTVDQLVTEVTTYQSAAYPAQDSPVWHGFPVDEGTW